MWRFDFGAVGYKKIKVALTLSVLLVACACTSRLEQPPGLCLSFDDRSIREWYELLPLFRKYNAKVTFFISQFDSLNDAEIDMLKKMQSEGHEIGSHGALHVVSENYIGAFGYKAWLKKEIDHNTDVMRQKGFDPVSFAYPYGAKYWFTDYLLLDRFKILRGVSDMHNHNVKDIDEIYFKFDRSKTVSVLGIDKDMLNESDVTSGIERVLNKKEVLLLLGHKPDKNFKGSNAYTFDPAFLEFILKEASEHQLKFYRVSDLIEN